MDIYGFSIRDWVTASKPQALGMVIKPLPYGGEGVNKAGALVIAYVSYASRPPSLEYQSVRTVNECLRMYRI